MEHKMTDKQRRAFWRQFTAACRNMGIPVGERDGYRRAVLKEEARVEHLGEVNSTDGFEAVMQRLAADAGDWERAAALTGGTARRIGAMINDCARQVLELSGTAGDAFGYAQGVLSRSGLERAGLFAGEAWYMDYPTATPVKIFQMLDSHRRRLIWRRRRETGLDIRLTYSFGASYKGGAA